MADATTNALGGYMPSTVNPYGLKTILPNINTLYPPTDPSVVDRALRGEALFTAPNQRDQGEFVIGQIQNLLNTAERELSPGGDTTIGGRLRGYLPFLPSAQEQLKMAQPILTIPREGEQAETFGYRRAAQNLISTIEGIQRQQQSTPVLQDTTQSGYMQQGVAPWVSALATGIRPVLAAPLAGLSMMTTTHPYIGGAIGTSPVRKIDTGEGTAYTFPEPYLDYPGDTAKERLQEHITSLAIQNAITADDQPLTNIFRGDTGVGTDLQFTPEEAMTSNISNALIDYAYDRDVQPELQAIAELTEVDPTFNFEKYLDPASKEVMDITSQVESFAGIPTVQPGAETPWTPPAPVIPDISDILKTYVPPAEEESIPYVEEFTDIPHPPEVGSEDEEEEEVVEVDTFVDIPETTWTPPPPPEVNIADILREANRQRSIEMNKQMEAQRRKDLGFGWGAMWT